MLLSPLPLAVRQDLVLQLHRRKVLRGFPHHSSLSSASLPTKSRRLVLLHPGLHDIKVSFSTNGYSFSGDGVVEVPANAVEVAFVSRVGNSGNTQQWLVHIRDLKYNPILGFRAHRQQ